MKATVTLLFVVLAFCCTTNHLHAQKASLTKATLQKTQQKAKYSPAEEVHAELSLLNAENGKTLSIQLKRCSKEVVARINAVQESGLFTISQQPDLTGSEVIIHTAPNTDKLKLYNAFLKQGIVLDKHALYHIFK